MSADDRTNGRKTLSPEFLPAPGEGVSAALSPPERVAARARLLLQRLRGLGTTAGAVVLSLQCTGYGVVDPLPPPPMQCTIEPTPFASIQASVVYATGTASPPNVLLGLYTVQYPTSSNFVGYSIAAVRVTGGTLVDIEDTSQSAGGGHTQFVVTIAPADAATTQILADVDFTCGGAATTKHYLITYKVPTGSNDFISVTEVPSADAGTD